MTSWASSSRGGSALKARQHPSCGRLGGITPDGQRVELGLAVADVYRRIGDMLPSCRGL